MPGTAAKVIWPSGASRVPALITVPPNKRRLPPASRARCPSLIIAPPCKLEKSKALGLPTRLPQSFWPIALNQLFSPKPIDLAVVAVKSAGILRLASEPKMMPAGFIKNKLELPPVTRIKPLISEGLPPTTRPRILRISGLARKFATCPESSPNS